MTEVSSTVGAVYLGAGHTQTAVTVRFHCLVGNWLEETRPAGSRIVLDHRFKERRAAAGTHVRARRPGIPVLPRESPLGSVFAQAAVLLPRQYFLPLFVSPGVFAFPGETKIQTRDRSDTPPSTND